MPDVLRDLLTSKKALVLIATIIVAVGNRILARWGMELNADTVNLIVASAAAYMVAQGISDHGKGAALIKANTTTTTERVDSGGNVSGQVVSTTPAPLAVVPPPAP